MTRQPATLLPLALLALTSCAGPVTEVPATAHTPAPIIDDGWIAHLLESDPRLAPLAARAAEHRLQLLVSEVITDPHGGPPTLRRHGYRIDAEYFYPASAIKLFAALGALEWLGEPGDADDAPVLDSPLRIHPLFEGESLATDDPSNLSSGRITIGHEVRKLAIVSDNRAHDRLLAIIGHQGIHERAWRAGFPTVRCVHRLGARHSFDENRRTPRITVELANGGTVEIPERTSPLSVDSRMWSLRGIGRAVADAGRVHDGPMDFTRKNSVSIRDLQNALISTLRPDIPLEAPGYRLEESHREHLATALRCLPRESENPRYDPEKYPDDWVKFLLPGLRRVVPPDQLVVSSKVGLAYGFTVENASIEDRRSGRSFFVTGCIYTNPNGILNDGVYGYDETAFPFWSALGEVLARRLLRPENSGSRDR